MENQDDAGIFFGFSGTQRRGAGVNGDFAAGAGGEDEFRTTGGPTGSCHLANDFAQGGRQRFDEAMERFCGSQTGDVFGFLSESDDPTFPINNNNAGGQTVLQNAEKVLTFLVCLRYVCVFH
jgi:hypothetical protein